MDGWIRSAFRRARRRCRCPLSRPSHVMSDDGLNDGPEPSLRQNSDDSFVSGKEKEMFYKHCLQVQAMTMIGTSEKR
jgi:hypothetical protein